MKEKLLGLGVFVDNEYLDLYCSLIESNRQTKKEKFKTQQHHIIPRCYFKFKDEPCDNSKTNLVNLLYADHIKAHYYLSQCISDVRLAGANAHVISFILKQKSTRADFLLEDILTLEEVQRSYELSRVWNALLQTGRVTSEETKRKQSLAHKGKAVSELTKLTASRVHKGKVLSEETKQKIRDTQAKNCKPHYHSEETKQLLSRQKQEYFKTHHGTRLGMKASDETRAKRGKPVRCIETGEIYLTSVWAAEAVGLKSSTGISNACKHQTNKLIGGYHWEYVN